MRETSERFPYEDSWLLGARLDLGVAALSFAARETLRPMPNECFSDQDGSYGKLYFKLSKLHFLVGSLSIPC